MISSPTTSRVVAPNSTGLRQPRLSRPSFVSTRRLSDVYTKEEDPGRFEHDFDEIEEIGSGEFGKVMRVRSKNGDDGDVYAIKKSKRFEGAKHRYVKFIFFVSQNSLLCGPSPRLLKLLLLLGSWSRGCLQVRVVVL